ncbi:hypothetical protein SELMODRAFT_414023 [Selaginella moellendorffii]|uniref:Methyltransferase domain-containing protein n=1 Tax=Selaginella moellendorffii TaxID=88036 RepID=D8RRD5_SELML|nr:hypothetical protein SELMODRAFT_414023 [Selaginella moellendorffii]
MEKAAKIAFILTLTIAIAFASLESTNAIEIAPNTKFVPASSLLSYFRSLKEVECMPNSQCCPESKPCPSEGQECKVCAYTYPALCFCTDKPGINKLMLSKHLCVPEDGRLDLPMLYEEWSNKCLHVLKLCGFVHFPLCNWSISGCFFDSHDMYCSIRYWPVRMESVRGGAPVDKAVDFANYFCTYSYLYHQKDMLSDRVRMDAYHSAVFKNKRHFQGKCFDGWFWIEQTVLDVGTGSGILAIWSAQAGAKKVYAVEATNMARHARSLASANGVGHIVEVIEGSIEEVSIPEKEQKNQEYQKSLADWSYFAQELNEAYGVDMSTLTMPYHEEQKQYYLQTSLWSNLYPGQVISTQLNSYQAKIHGFATLM